VTARRKPAKTDSELDTLVGWMGVTLRVPEGWSPVAVSGEGDQGYLKVVSPDTRYLELKWERPKGAVNIREARERYFERLRRAARKSRQELRIRDTAKGVGRPRPAEQAPSTYGWAADLKAVGCIWHCEECGRLVIAELVGDHAADLSSAAEIFRGVRDHAEAGPDGRTWNTWALYGLAITVPDTYRVEKNVLMTGHQRLLLRSGGAVVQAERWGLAEIALRGTDVRAWYEGREAAQLMRYAYRVEETELNGHPAFRLTGRNRVPVALWKLLKAPFTLMLPRFAFHGYVWQCPQSNRIYAVTGEQPRRSCLVEQVVERIACHGEAGD
jgi:hypothetical protein